MEEISIGEFARRSRLSVKALRLYDELGVLLPARVDNASGYRYYDDAQLGDARRIAMLRQLEFPLATIKELLTCEPVDAAQRIAELWRGAEVAHVARRHLAEYLVNQLNGKETPMNDVATRDMPERTVLCLKRNVDEPGTWALGKEFIAILRERPLPKIGGREGAMFLIFWGEVNADSDGPVEMCKPIPAAGAKELAAHYPELTLRIEPAHREAFVPIFVGSNGSDPAQFALETEALRAWSLENVTDPEHLDRTAGDLGVRITYLANEPITATSVPDCDFAIPFA